MRVSKIYIDMDGVLADFDRGVEEFCHIKSTSQYGQDDPSRDQLMWQEIRKISHFYDKRELMPGAK